MANELRGHDVALLAADGVDQAELTQPRAALETAGAHLRLLSVHDGGIQSSDTDIDTGDTFRVNALVSEVSHRDYDALILPGGATNAQRLRETPEAVEFVRAFADSGKPIGAIGHGLRTLIEAGVVGGRTLTSSLDLQTDLHDAGATMLNQAVVTDGRLVTSRGRHDLPAFCAAIVEQFVRPGKRLIPWLRTIFSARRR